MIGQLNDIDDSELKADAKDVLENPGVSSDTAEITGSSNNAAETDNSTDETENN